MYSQTSGWENMGSASAEIEIVRWIMSRFGRRGHRHYGENVSELQHALQAATFARQHQETDEIVVASLLHDFGHLLHDLDEDIAQQGVNTEHEQVGADALSEHFPAQIVEPIRLHAAAKRYLCWQHAGYHDLLSAASKQSLVLQGGVMSADEAERFQGASHFEAAIRVRHYDDMAKVVDMETAPLAYYEQLITRFVVR